MRRIFMLVFFITISCDYDSKDRLFNTLYHKTFIPKGKEGVTIEFVDSGNYIVNWGPDWEPKSEKKNWRIDIRISGTYLIMDTSEMKLVTLSDTLVTFSKGEFNPTFELKK